MWCCCCRSSCIFASVSWWPSNEKRFGFFGPVILETEQAEYFDSYGLPSVAYPGIFFGGGSTNSVEDRENRDLRGGSPIVRGSGSSRNLLQEISFHIVKFS